MALIVLMTSLSSGAFPQEVVEGIARIQGRGELKVGLLVAPQFPYTFGTPGNLKGMDIDLAAEVADLLGVQLSVDSSFESRQDLLDALAEGRIDIALAKYKRNLDDALTLRFSTPYSYLNSVLLVNRVAFVALKTEGAPEEVLGMRPSVIGTLNIPGYRVRISEHFPLADIVTYPTVPLLVEGLLGGACTTGLLDAAEARRLIADRPELALWLRYVELPHISDAVCMATGWQDSFLTAWLDIFIDSRGEWPSLDDLFQAYENEVLNEKK